MPSPRAALIDIEEFGLSHNESHTLMGTRLSAKKEKYDVIVDEEAKPPVFASFENEISVVENEEIPTLDSEINSFQPNEPEESIKKKKSSKKKRG